MRFLHSALLATFVTLGPPSASAEESDHITISYTNPSIMALRDHATMYPSFGNYYMKLQGDLPDDVECRPFLEDLLAVTHASTLIEATGLCSPANRNFQMHSFYEVFNEEDREKLLDDMNRISRTKFYDFVFEPKKVHSAIWNLVLTPYVLPDGARREEGKPIRVDHVHLSHSGTTALIHEDWWYYWHGLLRSREKYLEQLERVFGSDVAAIYDSEILPVANFLYNDVSYLIILADGSLEILPRRNPHDCRHAGRCF